MVSGQITTPRLEIWKDQIINLTEIPIGNKTEKKSFPDSWLVSVGITAYSYILLVGNQSPQPHISAHLMTRPQSSLSYQTIFVSGWKLPEDTLSQSIAFLGDQSGEYTSILYIRKDNQVECLDLSHNDQQKPQIISKIAQADSIRPARGSLNRGEFVVFSQEQITIFQILRVKQKSNKAEAKTLVVQLFDIIVDDLVYLIPGIEAGKLLDVWLWSRRQLFVLVEDEFGERVFAVFGCSLPDADVQELPEDLILDGGVCQPICGFEAGKGRDLMIMVKPDKALWVIDGSTAMVRVFDLRIMKYSTDTIVGQKISPQYLLNLTNLLNQNVERVFLPNYDPSSSFITICDAGTANLKIQTSKPNGQTQTLLISVDLERVDAIMNIRPQRRDFTQELISLSNSEDSSQYFVKYIESQRILQIQAPQPYLGCEVYDLGQAKNGSTNQYLTRKLLLDVESTYKLGFEQEVIGESRHMFPIEAESKNSRLYRGSILVQTVVKGFVQNLTVQCQPSGSFIEKFRVGRFGRIDGLACIDQSDNKTNTRFQDHERMELASLDSYIRKDYTVGYDFSSLSPQLVLNESIKGNYAVNGAFQSR